MTNHLPLTVSVVCPYRVVRQQFYVGPDRFVVRDVFLSVFWWIYCYNIRLDGNVCSFQSNIVTINPPKDTEKYIVDDKAVRSNKKLYHPLSVNHWSFQMSTNMFLF